MPKAVQSPSPYIVAPAWGEAAPCARRCVKASRGCPVSAAAGGRLRRPARSPCRGHGRGPCSGRSRLTERAAAVCNLSARGRPYCWLLPGRGESAGPVAQTAALPLWWGECASGGSCARSLPRHAPLCRRHWQEKVDVSRQGVPKLPYLRARLWRCSVPTCSLPLPRQKSRASQSAFLPSRYQSCSFP